MTAKLEPDLAQLLADASADDRTTVASWLKARAHGRAAVDDPPSSIVRTSSPRATISHDEGKQLVKFRLPLGEYVKFQTWCQQNGFTMAQALRELVTTVTDRARNR